MVKRFILILLVSGLFVMESAALDSIAQALKVKGKVQLTRNAHFYKVDKGDDFFNGDEIETKIESYAAIEFMDESSIIKLFPNSLLRIRTEETAGDIIKKNLLQIGRLWAKVEKRSGLFDVETPKTVITVKGTNFLLNYDEQGNTQLFTFNGEVEMMNKLDGQTATVKAGEMAETSGSGAIQVSAIDPDMIPSDVNNFINEPIEPLPKPQPQPQEKYEEEKTRPQERSEPSKSSQAPSRSGPFNMGGSVGSVSIRDDQYTQIRLLPEVSFGKIGIGLDIEFLIDQNGKIRKKDWNDWQDYLNKIYYIRYGQRGDRFFGRIGGFPTYTLGHGLIMKDYSNMLQYPDVRQIGLQLGGNLPVMGTQLEAFSSNITENQILAARGSFLPLGNLEIPFLRNIRVGGTLVTDRDQYGGLSDDAIDSIPIDTDGDGIYDDDDIDPDGDGLMSEENLTGLTQTTIDSLISAGLIDDYEDLYEIELDEDDITILGIDYTLPLISKKLFSLGHYAEFAHILKHKSGLVFPGFYSKFLIFNMNLEYRIFQDDFAPAYFNNLYDQQRAVISGDSIVVKESSLKNRVKSNGWFGSVTANIFNTLYLTAAYEDMYADGGIRNKSVWASASLQQRILPKLNRATIKYSQTDFDKLDRFKTPNAYIQGEVGYALGTNTELVAKYQQRYVDYDGNGKINDEEETITTMNFGVEFRF